MDIKTSNKAREGSTKIVPPPDKGRRSRKKASNKLGKGQIVGRRVLSVLKVVGKLGAFFMIIVFMLSVFLYAYSSEKFNLRSVRFYGCKELDSKELEQIVRRDFPANVLRIDLQKLKERLEKETWAKRVEIRRILPSDLIIYVQERTPAAIVEIQDELMAADKEGILLGRYDPEYGKLDVPVFKGVLGDDPEGYQLHMDENAARIVQGLEMLSEIEAETQQHTAISEVDISNRNNVKLLLVDDIAEVHLGNSGYGKRFRRLMENMSTYRDLKEKYGALELIDLRFDDKIIWRPIRTKDKSRLESQIVWRPTRNNEPSIAAERRQESSQG